MSKKTAALDPRQIRQGDVLLELLEAPAAFEKAFVPLKADADGSVTLAHGEVTGHRHRFQAHADGGDDAMLYAHPIAPSDPTLVRLLKPAPLVHEEHTSHDVPAGVARISRPYEYEGAELLRRVED